MEDKDNPRLLLRRITITREAMQHALVVIIPLLLLRAAIAGQNLHTKFNYAA